MGASKNSIVSIFILAVGLGTIGVGTGAILGTVGASNIGLIVNFLEIMFGLEVLPKGIYLIDTIPSELLGGGCSRSNIDCIFNDGRGCSISLL